MSSTRLRSQRIALSAAFLGLAGSMTACSSGPDESDTNVFYCVDEGSTIVDEQNCDDSDKSSRHYLAYGALPIGMLIGAKLTNYRRFRANDTAMRTSWGLPATGVVSNGTTKTGIIGRSGSSVGSPTSSGS